MRCKTHLTDLSSGVGVCATCLRERLLAVIAAQTRLERAAAVDEDRRKHEPPSLIFPRSVSPYVNRTKSDDDGATWIRHQRFYSTPQVGHAKTTTADFDAASAAFKKKHKFSLFSNLFGARSEKFNSDPRVNNHRESCDEPSSSSSSSSPSWFSAIFTTGRKNQQFSRTSRVEHFTQFGHRDRRSCAVDRGMSPAVEVNPEDECDRSPPGSSPEVSPRWKRTPTRASRGKTGARNKSGMAFCLSPLVRASPNRQWNQRSGLAPDMTHTTTSEGRPAMKPQLGSAARFCANRSKKIADFGRVNHNR
ncbi:hypothetical protein like AT2G44600 [Hibiscus trionum]|uniref:Uncharacterized protein n=1 Tax=Hibiscus trionum TaxID=183268 RepID=A0A9W7LJC1_HIBTR|nr:hypothetical protein like AT2G44600 [Hibiscus trionum]